MAGLEGAILLQHFRYWTIKNSSEEDMCRDGRIWVFSSRRALNDLFPFLSDQKIRTTIDKLIEAGYLIKGEYSLSMKNKSNWYSLSDYALALFNGEASLVKTTNALAQSTNVKNNNKENILSIEEKRRILAERCEPFVAQYGRQMIDAFVSYWGEANGSRLRCEIAKQKSGAFEISRRLATWASKEYNQPRNPVTTASAPTGRPIWESLGMTKEQYLKMQGK